MVDINDILGIKDENLEPVVETEPVVAPEPVVTPAAPVEAVEPVKVAAKADEFEVLPGVWQINVPVTQSFTLPDGTWVRPTQLDGATKAAVPAEWVDWVRALKG
jgi:hypothetical protein